MFQRFLETGKRSTLLLASVVTALACLTRYTGLMIILTGLILLLAQRNRPVKNRLRNGLLFSVIAVLPLAAWIARNYIVTATLTGLRGPSSLTLLGSIKAALSNISAFFLPLELADEIRVVLVGLAFILLAVLMVILLRRTETRGSVRGQEYLALFTIFTVTYIGFMVISATFSNSDPVNRRLASPVYIPLVLMGIIVIMNIPALWQSRPWRPAANAFLAVMVCAWLIFPFWQITNDIRASIHDGAPVTGNYATRTWNDSETVNYLKENTRPGQVVSNGPDVIYYFTETRTALAPMKYIENSPGSKLNDLSAITTRLEEGGVFLVWFDAVTYRDFLFTAQELQTYFDMDLYEQFSDGSIYSVRQK
jgi:hypothetical protein